MSNIHSYETDDFDEAFETDQPIAAGPPVDADHVLRKDDMPSISGGGLGNNLLVKTDNVGSLDSVDDLTDFIAGTADEVSVSDDGDGTVTIGGAGENTNTVFSIVVAIQAGGAGGIGFQYKTRDVVLSNGIVKSVSAESAWNDV